MGGSSLPASRCAGTYEGIASPIIVMAGWNEYPYLSQREQSELSESAAH